MRKVSKKKKSSKRELSKLDIDGLDLDSTVSKKKKPKKKKKKKRRIKKGVKILFVVFIVIVIVALSVLIYLRQMKLKNDAEYQENLYYDILDHYNEFVMTNKDADIYKFNNNKFVKVGKVGNKQELTLLKKDITYEDEYLKINTFDDEYYIHYKDLDVIEELSKYDDRYKKYVMFNKNILTKNVTSFYDIEGNLVYTLSKSFELPIIVDKKDIYGVEINGRLLFVKKEDVLEIKDNKNTDGVNTKGIAVLNYHFFFDGSSASERADCNQIICLSTDNLKKHLDYIKNNNIFTPTMEELEMYIDGYIQLPKSVVLTVDDGWRADIGSNIMAQYKLNGTVFLMSGGYSPEAYKNDYIEVHSHGHDLHNPGVCPGGQGGAIKCLDRTKLLADLKTSQDKLYGTTVFCYPFYEYNNYSIEVLKEAGFTMAFGGYGEGGYYKVVPGINKYKLPRYVVYSYTSVNNIASYIN